MSIDFDLVKNAMKITAGVFSLSSFLIRLLIDCIDN